MLNIVIPMAGRGSRFANEGYLLPKPLIDVRGKPMIERVVENLTPKSKHKFIFLVLEDHIQSYAIDAKLQNLAPGCEIIVVHSVTEGAACTVLLAKGLINNTDSLMIANSDQWINYDINEYVNYDSIFDGMIMTMYANDPKWSFIDFNQEFVSRVVEKEVISNEATVGIYNFSKGSDFVDAAETMISKDLKVNGEFYVAPAYNELILCGKKIGYKNIDTIDETGMHGLGTPEDLRIFLDHEISRNI